MTQIDGTIQRSYTKWVVAFVFVALAMICSIIYLTFSKTVITLYPEPQTVDTTITFKASEEVDTANLEMTEFPARIFTITVEGSDLFSGSGTLRTEDGYAHGTVVLKNTSGSAQPLVATTRLLSEDGALFRLDQAVTVPANGEIEASVTADQPGSEYEISPTTFTIPGLNTTRQTQVFAESTDTMQGGVTTISSLTAEDIANARDAMAQTLYKEAITELEHDIAVSDSPYKIVIPGTVHRIVGMDEVDANPGDERSEFRVSMTMKVTAVMFNEDAVLSYVTDQLKTKTAKGMELSPVTNEDVAYSVTRVDTSIGAAEVAVQAEAPALLTLNSEIVNREAILNKDATDIKAYFTSFEEIADVRVDFSPFWVVRAPSLIDHIEIEIKQPTTVSE